MSLLSVKTLIQQSLTALDAPAVLRAGRESDINTYSERDSPLYWFTLPYAEPFAPVGNQGRYIETHNIIIYIVKQDKESADNLESFQIISDCEVLAQKLLLWIYEKASGIEQADINGASITQVIKFKAVNTYTGVSLSFTISFPNTETIC